METSTHTRHLRPYTKKELAALYGISTRTITSWLLPFERQIGPKRGRYFNLKQMKIIFEALGYPD